MRSQKYSFFKILVSFVLCFFEIENFNSNKINTPRGTFDSYDVYNDTSITNLTHFNPLIYFENLTTYSPYNSAGSCGYVSLIQVLSFYDTFYNDNIIPENYEFKNLHSTSYENAIISSPGVKREQYISGLIYNTYHDFCHNTMNDNLQSKLTVLLNVKDKTDNNGYIINEGKIKYNFEPGIGGWRYEELLNLFYANLNLNLNYSIDYHINYDQNTYITYIKNKIDNGMPCIVHIKKYNEITKIDDCHSVVAYDYDDNYIYANFGWSENSNHIPLIGGIQNYDEIYAVFSFDFSSTSHIHSDNYMINGEAYCGCNIKEALYFITTDIYRNIPPTIYRMRDPNNREENYSIIIRGSRYDDDLLMYSLNNNSITFPINDWNLIINSCVQFFFVVFTRVNSTIPSNTFCFNVPLESSNELVLYPSDYGFEERYYFENEGIRSKEIIKDGYLIETSRLRCGYIEEEYINLSSKRENAGHSYLKYKFNNFIYRIDTTLTLWSTQEALSYQDDVACFKYKNTNNEWIIGIDLLYDIGLSTNRYSPDVYRYVFKEPAKEIMFEVSSSATGTRNKGRICIGNMHLYFMRG